MYHDLYLCVKTLAERENVGFDLARPLPLFHRRPPTKDVGLRLSDSHTVMSVKDFITNQTCKLSQEDFNDFLSLYPVPSEYHVILPKSNLTIFYAPPRYVGLYTHSFYLINLRLPLTEFFYEVGSSRPPVKRKLASGSSTSRATHAKTSSSKDDAPFLTVSDDDEGLPDVLELKDTNACHIKIFSINPVAWKNHLDNHIDLELLDLHDCCYARQVVVDNGMNKRREVVSKVVPYDAIELVHSGDMGSLVGKLVSSAIVYGRCRAFEQVAGMKEPFGLSKVNGYHSFYKKDHTQASNDLATTTFPWLDEFVVDPSAPIEALLPKKPSTLQRPTPSRNQVPLVSSQRATPSSVLAFNLMSPPTDASVVKP
uniref:Uncharacterized protein n=1 Tax=Tanacetum cinerariifolium TaxID=118510 RepID=A0A6L2MJR8_TANCI|nr:hypothetical protein [Tanacetum cinerariifolium]